MGLSCIYKLFLYFYKSYYALHTIEGGVMSSDNVYLGGPANMTSLNNITL